MFILIPAWPRSEEAPPLTASLVAFTVLCFLITWPWQQHQGSVVSQERYEDQANALVAILINSGRDLRDADRNLIEQESKKSPFPSADLVSLFSRVNSDPLYLSAEARYRWSQAYPVFNSMERAVALHPGLSTPFERFGYQPNRGWWPGLFTHLFLHAGWLHIFFNMLFLWTAGVVLERRLGMGILPLYFSGGVVAALVQAQSMGSTSQTLVGASGAIAALMGFALIAMPTARITLFYAYFSMSGRAGTFESPLWFCIPLWIMQQVFMLLMPLKGALANVGYGAHVGGFVFGAVMGVFFRLLTTSKQTAVA